MLFFVVYVVLCHLQELFGFDAVRFLTENAGSMQVVNPDRKSNDGQTLEQSEHFRMFLYCLGLFNKLPVRQWIWDTSPFYGIRRKRVFLRSHLDTAVPLSEPAPGDEIWGPLISLDNRISPLAPLLRTRGCTPGGVVKLSWTGYQPCALMWNYTFFGGKRSFALLCQLAAEDKFPKLPWASIIPAHFLPIWKSFITALQADKTAATRKDELIDQLIPIFHNPNIILPMRILTVQEVRKLAGLENIPPRDTAQRSSQKRLYEIFVEIVSTLGLLMLLWAQMSNYNNGSRALMMHNLVTMQLRQFKKRTINTNSCFG